ncbi:MAG: hypothetical protein IPH23_14565 [Gammaproteobacteria bacterium]|nr:hypothetical protein [Gammaproteobacteria bacterium]
MAAATRKRRHRLDGESRCQQRQAQRLNLLQGRERVRQAAVSHGLRWLMEDWLAERRRQRLATRGG